METPITIEKGVPVPELGGKGFTKILREMEAGDSFLIPASRRYCASNCAKGARIKIVTRTEKDGNVRVWKIE